MIIFVIRPPFTSSAQCNNKQQIEDKQILFTETLFCLQNLKLIYYLFINIRNNIVIEIYEFSSML